LSPDRPLDDGTLCWVLRGRHSKVKRSAATANGHGVSEEQRQRKALFNRAWTVGNSPATSYNDNQNGIPSTANDNHDNDDDNENRILVQYRLGSTYHVRRVNLLPVLSSSSSQLAIA